MGSTGVLWPAGVFLGLLAGCGASTETGEGNAGQAPRPNPPGGASVTADDIERNPSQPIERLLESRFPGVVVTRGPDGSISLRIRGATSIYGSNEPLFVIDGVAIEPGPGGALFGINPYDIETIEVLKDAASTSMFGVRGANGVIVINTKQPVRPDH
jgi:TonB-dependent SusC/RagA subfamily outer membrane receptor